MGFYVHESLLSCDRRVSHLANLQESRLLCIWALAMVEYLHCHSHPSLRGLTLIDLIFSNSSMRGNLCLASTLAKAEGLS